ncbi:sensor histidine kinase [Marinomonas algarum]|uniref:histidine kinase n=1 Tax=Marinomonas algarum TaxID=2883105 RepID=A0A9X1LEN6_9GAMM|nr:HAMP domain-containing sensor histidine kinase [Marinomonas algarum]MCB5161743.1 HAMP domain-containing histidine kinase [Marinomonas algarum]
MKLDALFSQKKPLLTMLLSALLAFVLVISWGSYRFFMDHKINQLALDEAELLSRSVNVFGREVGHIRRVTLLLRNSIQARLGTDHDHLADAASTLSWDDRVAAEFTRFAQTSRLISQVRWLSADGQELIRVNSQAGQISRVPDRQLQDKSDRRYMKNVPDIMTDDVFISSLDLNIENKEIVRPLQPTIRGIVRVDGATPGFLVVNYDLTSLFNTLRTFNREEVYLEIVDANGDWVMAKDPLIEWGGILRLNSAQTNIQQREPDIWQDIQNLTSQQRAFDKTHLISLHKVFLDENNVSQQNSAAPLFFMVRSQQKAMATWRLTLIGSVVGIGGLAFYMMAWLVWRQVTSQFETYRLLALVQQEKAQAEQTNEQMRLTNKQLIDLQDELVETNKLSSLGLMLAGLAHEMHTPLGGVRMALSSSLSWLEKEADTLSPKGYEGIKKSLAIADKNLLRALEVVSSFKRIVSDRTAQEIQTFFLHNVIDDILFTFKPELKKRVDIRLEIDCPDTIKMVGYPGVMSQIIQNLISNALEHAFQPFDNGVIALVARKEKGNLVMVISDNGRGIAPDIKPRIFEPFITTGRMKQHTGLGLHLVRQWLCQLMKGRIEVTSDVGAGSKFTLTIPLEQAQTEET